MRQGRGNLLGVLFMLGAAASFAAFSATVKLIGPRMPLFEIVFFRGLVAWALLVSWEKHRSGTITPGVDRKGLLFRSLLGLAGLVMYVLALNHIDLGLASALNQSSPMFVALFAFLVLRERPRLLLVSLIVTGFAGATLIVSPDLGSINLFALVGLSSAVVSGLAYTWVRKLRATESPQTIVRWFSGTVSVCAIPVLLWQGFVVPVGLEWLYVILLGVLSLSGQLCLSYSLRLGEAAVVSPFLYSSVLINFGVGWFVWQEWPAGGALVGAALLLFSSTAIGFLGSRNASVSDG